MRWRSSAYFGSILVDDTKANESISKTEKNAKSLGTRFTEGAKTVAKWGTALSGVAVAGGAAIFAMGVKVGAVSDRLLDLNSITGMSTSEIQKWQQVATVAGVGAESMTNASQKLTKQLSLMDSEGNKSRQALEGLGLSIDEVTNMNADERMNVITEALAGVEDKTLRAQYGTDLLGGSFKEIAPILDVGTEKLKQIKDNANIISEEDLNKANDFRIKVDQLKERFGIFFMELSLKVLPILTTFFDWITQYMPQIQEFVGIAFTKISEYVALGIEWIGKLIDWLKQWYTDNEETLNTIQEGFMLFFETVKEFIQSFIELATKFWHEYGDGILAFITEIWDLIKGIFQTAFDLIIDIFNVFSALFKGDWSALWENIKTLAYNLWNNIKVVIEKALNIIYDVVTNIWNTIKNKVSEIATNIWNSIKQKFDDIKNAIKERITTAKDNVVNGFNEALKFLKGISLYSIGKDIIQGLINGISNKITALKNKMKDVASSVTSTVKNLLGINSPSKVFEGFGNNLGEGLAIGVEDTKKKVSKATESMAGATTSVMNSKSNPIQRAAQQIVNITVQGNIDKDLYNEIMRKQKNDFDTRLTVAGVRL